MCIEEMATYCVPGGGWNEKLTPPPRPSSGNGYEWDDTLDYFSDDDSYASGSDLSGSGSEFSEDLSSNEPPKVPNDAEQGTSTVADSLEQPVLPFVGGAPGPHNTNVSFGDAVVQPSPAPSPAHAQAPAPAEASTDTTSQAVKRAKMRALLLANE